MQDTSNGDQPQRWLWLSRALWAAALSGLLYLVGLTVWLGLAGLLFPYQLDYGEGLLLHFVNEWAHSRPIYGPLYTYPYITANYPPLSIVLALALTPLVGVGYLAGRVWTLLAIAAIAALILAWVRRAGGRWLPAVVAALLFVGSPYVYHWAPLFRVDLAGLALTLAGLYVIFRAFPPPVTAIGRKPREHLLWLAVLLFVAALYAKQSFVFAPAAAALYLFFFIDRRQAIRLVAAMGLLGGGLFLLIDALTGGGFWQGLVVSNVNPFLWPEFWQQVGHFGRTFAVLVLLSAWYGIDKFALDRSTPVRQRISPFDLYLPAALLSLVFAGKAGAWENYFFEALAALSLGAGLGLARAGSSPARLSRYRRLSLQLLAPLLLLAQAALMWHTPRVANRYLSLTRRSNEAIAPLLARTPDPLFSEDMGLLVTHGKVLDYCSFQYSQLARAGRWDQSWELGQLRERRRSAVILEQGTRLDVDRYQRFSREFLSELDRNYRLARRLGKYEVYEPDPLQHERRAEFGDALALVGWSVHTPPDLKPGDTVSLTVVWQAQRTSDKGYTAFAHLVDEAGRGWAGDDHVPRGGLYPTSAWGAGEMVRDTFRLTVPADAPPALYHVQVGWYDPASQARLPVGASDSFTVAMLPIQWSAIGKQAMTPLGQPFGEVIVLEGYAWEVGPEALQVTLRWSTSQPLDDDYRVFVHLVDPAGEGQALTQGDASPLDGRWPTAFWLPGVPLDDTHTVPLPDDLPAGRYRLLVGLYDPLSGERLRLPDGRDALLLGEVELP